MQLASTRSETNGATRESTDHPGEASAPEAPPAGVSSWAPYLQVTPLVLVLLCFFVVPIALVVIVSFFRYQMLTGLTPAFTFASYFDFLSNPTTWWLYFSTLRFTLIVLVLTFLIGFWIAYFLVFHVRSLIIAMGLFLVCTVPFWTSDIIRMIAWRPVLGREGLINDALIHSGIVAHPLSWLLYSNFSVILTYVYLDTMFMIVPIFNAMARIDRSLLEVAVDAGASRWAAIRDIVLPLSKTGIALGALFVVTLVMGDFFVINVMSGGLAGSAMTGMANDLQVLNYPRAAANAVILLVIVLLIASGIFRLVDVRRELVR